MQSKTMTCRGRLTRFVRVCVACVRVLLHEKEEQNELTMLAFFMTWLMTTMTLPLKPCRVPVTAACASSPSRPDGVLQGMLMLPGTCPRLKLGKAGQGQRQLYMYSTPSHAF